MSSHGKNHGSTSTDATTDLLRDRLEIASLAGTTLELETHRFARTLLLCVALTLGSPHLALADELPNVSDRPPVPAAHFPDAAHAVVWRNWQLVEPRRLSAVLGTSTGKVIELAESMGLPPPVRVPREMRERGYITLVRRNWHLLPYEQLLELLDMSADELAFRLREDDFLYAKLGSLKPHCERVSYRKPDAKSLQRAAEIRTLVHEQLGDRFGRLAEPRFGFIDAFNRAGSPEDNQTDRDADQQLRFIYSYFAVFGDPLASPQLDPFPDGLLARLRGQGVNGDPSLNLELASMFAARPAPAPSLALETLAQRHFGPLAAPYVRRAWTKFGRAFLREYPYDGGVLYNAPQQLVPANLLYNQSTGYLATMVGFPYDDLTRWRGPYPSKVFADQFQKVADGWAEGLTELKAAQAFVPAELQLAAAADLRVAQAAHVHFASVANQARFVMARDALVAAQDDAARHNLRQELNTILIHEIELARRLFELSSADSRLGYEASNHYYYVPLDLVEKVINCEDLKTRLVAHHAGQDKPQ